MVELGKITEAPQPAHGWLPSRWSQLATSFPGHAQSIHRCRDIGGLH